MWDVPGGGVNDEGKNGKEPVLDESPFASVDREVGEEIGKKLKCLDGVLTTRA
jgi:ADP-ribose pyrophosphatase YjhB (NUDIX family)